MLSTSSKNAIRAVLYLTINSGEENKISPKEIAKEIKVPAPFLAKILQELSRHNIISSTKGRNGGFYLTEDNKKNQVLSIIECTDGLDKLTGCFLGTPSCSESNPCAIHHVIAPLKNNLIEELSCKSIEEFSMRVKKNSLYVM